MKNITDALRNFLLAQNEFSRFDLIRIELPNGQFIFASNCPVPVNYLGNVYHATKYGVWERGSITSEVAETPKSGSMSLTVAVSNEDLLSTIVYPGTTMPLFQAAALGLFDNAEVFVFKFYVGVAETPQQGLDSKGVEIAFGGVIANPVRSTRSKFSFKAVDILYMLNVQFPGNIVQSACPWQLYDARCALNKADFASPSSVGANSNSLFIRCATIPQVTVGSLFTAAAGDYTQGRLTFTSGENAGFTHFIKLNTFEAGVAIFQMFKPLVLPISPGDSFTAYPGCDKTIVRCTKFANTSHFRGFRFIPNPEKAA